MATLRQIKKTGYWQIRFYWQGEQQQRSCGTKRRADARRTLASVEDTIQLLKTGRLEMPANVNPFDWIVSGGKLKGTSAKKADTKKSRLGAICDSYFEEQHQKQESTLNGETMHIRHLKRLLNGSTLIQCIDLDILKQYRRRRSNEKHHGEYISDATIRKELVTFRQIWTWAKQNEYVSTICPLLEDNGRWKIAFEKSDPQEKFRTWDQIERRIARGSLSGKQVAALWRGLFLDATQVSELLKYVESHARHPFIYPMFAFAAYTGARRSEILRSEIEDFDFDNSSIMIREKKRRKKMKSSVRMIPFHPALMEIMQNWFTQHPGGRFTIAPPKQMRGRPKNIVARDHFEPGQAYQHFKVTLRQSKWKVVSGFHVLRHSFGSNLIRSRKVTSDVVAKWMGHSTTEMAELYQHIFPQDGLHQIAALDYVSQSQ